MKINSIYFDSSKPTCHIECWNSSDMYDAGQDEMLVFGLKEERKENI